MTRKQFAVLLVVLAVLLIAAAGLALWDGWLYRHQDPDTISWSFAMLTVYHPLISHGFAGLVGFVLGFLACHFLAFTIPDPSVYAELDATRASLNSANSELARLRPYARRLYRPDGSFEVSPDWAEWEAEEVGRARRLAEAEGEAVRLRVRVAELEAGVGPNAGQAEG